MELSSGPVLPKVTSPYFNSPSPSSVLSLLSVLRKPIMRPTTSNKEFPTLDRCRRATPLLLSPGLQPALWLNQICSYLEKVLERNDASNLRSTYPFNLSTKVHPPNLELFSPSNLRSNRMLSPVLPLLLGEEYSKNPPRSVKHISRRLLTKAARDWLLDRIHIRDYRTLPTEVRAGH